MEESEDTREPPVLSTSISLGVAGDGGSASHPRSFFLFQVLELCGNQVDSLKDLCAHPPPALQHLGLGHNGQLGSSEDQYLTHAFW